MLIDYFIGGVEDLIRGALVRTAMKAESGLQFIGELEGRARVRSL